MNKIDIKYWDALKAPAEDMDIVAIGNAFDSDELTDSQKEILAQLILASRVRLPDGEQSEDLNTAIGIFNSKFAVEEFFYAEFANLYCTWRYDYRKYVRALPVHWARRAIKRIYFRLGVELDEAEVMSVYNSDCIYSAFFDLIKDTLKGGRYFAVSNKDRWSSFAFVAYFNMWNMFGPLGFNGYSPYVICSDIGVISPPASHWKLEALTDEEAARVQELQIKGRGRKWPTWQQNRFMAEVTKI